MIIFACVPLGALRRATEFKLGSGSAVEPVGGNAMEGDPQQIIQILGPVAAPHITPPLLLTGIRG